MWKIKGVRGNKERPNRARIIRSPPAYVGGYWWTVKFFLRGNGVDALSIYIECSKEMPQPGKELPDTEFTFFRGPPDAVLKQPEMHTKFSRVEDSAGWFETFRRGYPIDAAAKEPVKEDSKTVPWRVSAQIGVLLYNPEEPYTGWMQSSCHQFTLHSADWGWTRSTAAGEVSARLCCATTPWPWTPTSGS
jgi:hypothetical protein